MENITKEIKVKINPNSKQRELFKRNFGSCRKVYNEVLGRYNSLYGEDNSITPTWELLNKLFDETKQELHYLDEVESTSLQESIVDLHSDFNDYFTNESNNYPKFHTKKKTKWSFRQIPDNNSVIEGDKLFLRK